MPVFYNFTQSGLTYSFDDVFVPADLFREGNLWVWGYNITGQLGTNDTINKSTPVTTFAGSSNWKQVSVGGNHTAAIKTDGTLWTWGFDGYAKLGRNAVGGVSNIPITTFAGGTNWKQVSCGSNHTAAIKTDGTLWVWGRNTYGRLGNNLTLNASTPVTTFAGGTNWKQVSSGNGNTSAIKTDGTLWVWGQGARLGNNATTSNALTPITTFAGGTNWKQVSTGTNGMAAIKTDGTLWVWGAQGTFGLLGTADSAIKNTPVTTFAGGTNWKQVSIDDQSAAAVKTDGTLWTWGYQSLGILGNAVVALSAVTTPITTFAGGNNWKQVSCKRENIAAIKTDGTLWIWGSGSQTKLGNLDINNKSTPITTFAGGTNWKEVSVGFVSGDNVLALTYIDAVI